MYLAAKELADVRADRLYFEWLNRDRVRGKHSATILHHGMVAAACFLPDMTKILTTNGEGQIKVKCLFLSIETLLWSRNMNENVMFDPIPFYQIYSNVSSKQYTLKYMFKLKIFFECYQVWDVTSGEVLHRFTGHKSGVKTLAVSPGKIFHDRRMNMLHVLIVNQQVNLTCYTF